MTRDGTFRKAIHIFLPFLLPGLLIGFSFWRSGIVQRHFEAQLLQERSAAAQSKLEQLRAADVASTLDARAYESLLDDFSKLTGLDLRAENGASKGEVSAQLGRFIDTVVDDLNRFGYSETGEPYLIFKSVTPGKRQVIDRILAVDFEMNLEGKYLALPLFLDSLSRIAREQNCPVSVGGIRVMPVEPGSNSGVLKITIPLRAYFLEH